MQGDVNCSKEATYLLSNRMLGLLKRTCPLVTAIKVRRTLYLALVKSQLCYASEVWSH